MARVYPKFLGICAPGWLLIASGTVGALADRPRGRTVGPEMINWRHRKIPRYAWHKPPWLYDTTAGLKSYQPPAHRSSETREIKEDFRRLRRKLGGGTDPVADEGIIWLAPEWPTERRHYSRRGVRIDLSKVDPKRLLYTFQAEGFMLHLGPISPKAFSG